MVKGKFPFLQIWRLEVESRYLGFFKSWWLGDSNVVWQLKAWAASWAAVCKLIPDLRRWAEERSVWQMVHLRSSCPTDSVFCGVFMTVAFLITESGTAAVSPPCCSYPKMCRRSNSSHSTEYKHRRLCSRSAFPAQFMTLLPWNLKNRFRYSNMLYRTHDWQHRGKSIHLQCKQPHLNIICKICKQANYLQNITQKNFDFDQFWYDALIHKGGNPEYKINSMCYFNV